MLRWLRFYRGAVRPPFIEAETSRLAGRLRSSIGGQSAPPSLKLILDPLAAAFALTIGGQSAPPSLKQGKHDSFKIFDELSGGSPPPLH